VSERKRTFYPCLCRVAKRSSKSKIGSILFIIKNYRYPGLFWPFLQTAIRWMASKSVLFLSAA
jgi:hypothetical protein